MSDIFRNAMGYPPSVNIPRVRFRRLTRNPLRCSRWRWSVDNGADPASRDFVGCTGTARTMYRAHADAMEAMWRV